MKLSVVIPVYNEKDTILTIISNVKKQQFDKEIIVVDDASTDGTVEVLKQIDEEGVKVFFHSQNTGKGGALRTGFKEVSGDVVIIQDADTEYDPCEYQNLLEPIEMGVADVVYGSRLSGGRPQRVYLFWHRLGNAVISFVAGLLYNTTLTDIETGYKVFKADVVKKLDLKSNGFEIEPEITAKVCKRHLRVYEIPISYYGRTYDEGKKIHWYHGFGAIWTLIKYRFID